MVVWIKIPSGEGGEHYYWDPDTQETRWERPEEAVEWQAQNTPTGTYYWNQHTRETRWDVPTATATSSIPTPVHCGATSTLQLGCSSIYQFTSGTGGRSWCRGTAKQQQQQQQPVEQPPVGSWPFTVKHRGDSLPSRPTQRASSNEATADGTAAGSAQWVALPGSDGRDYFWDFEAGHAVNNLPAGAKVRWRAYQNAAHAWYYVDVGGGPTLWSVPGLPESQGSANADSGADGSQMKLWWCELGAAVILKGLREARYNDHVAQVIDIWDDEIVVKLPDCQTTVLSVLPQNIHPLSKNAIVEFSGLSGAAASLNGTVGTVESVDVRNEESKRYMVKLRDGSLKSVKGIKLKVRSRLWNLNLEDSQTLLQWRKEQQCLLIDSTGNHRRFSVHLPLGFPRRMQSEKVDAESPERRSPSVGSGPIFKWPVLVYLHGTGGTSFLTHSKKAIRSDGVLFAARNFVIVSPHCDWNWKEQPKQWVIELVLELRAAEWVDHRRIYVTGCSMGGMSTWEVGAMRPDLFAAIAPVAGHHQVQRRAAIASQLCKTPVFAVHSIHDETCPWQVEEGLWYLLMHKENNPRFQLNITEHVDHCSMHERTYCETTMLYEWLLMFKNE